ncbi:MAG TPA: GNAT family N-acetyltransferase [Candidatus Coproplasma stercoravium]|nr:GNAT family N-acetyltransferase [Candidatus Coproplasma stercoravium]
MTIRKAEPKDLQIVFKITHTTISEIYPRYYPSGAVKFFLDYHSKDAVAKDISDGKVFICYAPDGTAAGTATLCGNEIQRLYVLPEYQGMGFGGALVEFAEQELFKTVDEVIVEASLPAKGLYKKRGYTETEYLNMEAENGDFLCWDKMSKHR